MHELLAGSTGQPADSETRESTPSVEMFQSSPQSQVSPPAISDAQPAVLQPVSHQMQRRENGLGTQAGVQSSHPQPVNGLYQAPTAIPPRLFNGGFQPALSSTPTTVDSVPNGLVLNQQHGSWNGQPFVNRGLGGQPLGNHAGLFPANGMFYICTLKFFLLAIDEGCFKVQMVMRQRFWEASHPPLSSPNPTLTLSSHFRQNVGLGEGRGSSWLFPEFLPLILQFFSMGVIYSLSPSVFCFNIFKTVTFELIVGVLFLLAFFLAL